MYSMLTQLIISQALTGRSMSVGFNHHYLKFMLFALTNFTNYYIQDAAAGGGGGGVSGREKSVSWKITYTNPVCVDTDSGINMSDSDIHGVWLGDTKTTTNNPTDSATAAQTSQGSKYYCRSALSICMSGLCRNRVYKYMNLHAVTNLNFSLCCRLLNSMHKLVK